MTDAFDDTLDSLADVLTKETGTADDYGVSTHNFVTISSGVPCRVSLGRGRAREDKSDKKTALNYREVFMRPYFDPQGNKLSHNNWLRINNQLYDVYQVDNPGEQNHHFEVWCTLVLE
jgi:hypothetical protein